ncbi:MAG: PDZ domain-containing protein, partial [Clostridiales bacterium]|nr:PDZ domain-containing protein [Clostridiales bacterium]
IAITKTPKGRARQSGIWLGLYSILILLLAVISSRIYWVKYLAAISAPVFHEMMIVLSKREQIKGKSHFSVPWEGVRVLDVFPDSIGDTMGLESGDIIYKFNGKSVNSVKAIEEFLFQNPTFIWLDVKREQDDLIL